MCYRISNQYIHTKCLEFRDFIKHTTRNATYPYAPIILLSSNLTYTHSMPQHIYSSYSLNVMSWLERCCKKARILYINIQFLFVYVNLVNWNYHFLFLIFPDVTTISTTTERYCRFENRATAGFRCAAWSPLLFPRTHHQDRFTQKYYTLYRVSVCMLSLTSKRK